METASLAGAEFGAPVSDRFGDAERAPVEAQALEPALEPYGEAQLGRPVDG